MNHAAPDTMAKRVAVAVTLFSTTPYAVITSAYGALGVSNAATRAAWLLAVPFLAAAVITHQYRREAKHLTLLAHKTASRHPLRQMRFLPVDVPQPGNQASRLFVNS